MSLRISFALVMVLAGVSVDARADIIVLINHVEYRGVIVSEDKDRVIMLSGGEEHKFFRDMIASLKYDEATAAQEREQNKRRAAADAAQAPVKLSPVTIHVDDAPVVQPDSGSVTLYGTRWCGYCEKARALLRHHNVPFADRDIEQDESAAREMQGKCAAAGISPRGVPVLDLFGTMVHGFNQAEITRLLRKHGY